MKKSRSESKKQKIIKALNFVDPSKPMGTELFNAVARISVSVAIEAIVLRKNKKNNKIEVFLTKRLKNQAYSKMWHMPGTILRPGETEKKAFLRLSKEEFKAPVKPIKLIEMFNNTKAERGHALHLLYLCKVENSSKENWFSITNLPLPIVECHRDIFIPKAVAFFES